MWLQDSEAAAKFRQRGFLLVADLASVFLFSGIIFGWAPLSAMLVDEGFYSHQCVGEPAPCDAQANSLNLAFTIGSTAVSFLSIPAGMLVDKFGPAVGTVVAAVLEISGLIGIAVCEDVNRETGFDLFLVSFTMISVGGAFTMFNAYSAPFLFKSSMNVVIELTACLFDGSCIIFTFFKMAYDAGVPFSTLWWFFVGLAGGVYALLILAWIVNAKELKESRAVDSTPSAEEAKSPHADSLPSKPLLEQVRTLEFVAVCLYAAIQVPRSNLYLGSVDLTNREYALLYDWPDVDRVISIIGLIIPLGFAAVPFIEASIHYLDLIGTFLVCSALGLLYNFLQLVPAQSAQLLGAVVFAAFRAFLFSILAAFNGATFGPTSMGSIMGLCMFVSSIVNLGQAPNAQLIPES